MFHALRIALATVALTAAAVGITAAQAPAATPSPSVDYYTLQVTPPGGAHDHRQRYVGVETASTSEPVRLATYGSNLQNPKLLWQPRALKSYEVDASGHVSKPFRSYMLVNMATGNCLSYKLPWMEGTGVFQQAAGCRGWALDSGGGRGADITDKTGGKNGFALKMIDQCLDLAEGSFAVGTPLVLRSCQSTWSQRFLLTLRVRDHRTMR